MKEITVKMNKSDKGFQLEKNQIHFTLQEWVNEIMEEIENEIKIKD